MTKRYRDPSGRLLIWPTFLRFLGDLCGLPGFAGLGGIIVSIVTRDGIVSLIGSIVLLLVFGGLLTVLHNAADKSAARKIYAWYERHEASQKRD